MALNLLRRPLITVYTYILSATTHFLRCESVCVHVSVYTRLCTYLHMQIPNMYVHLDVYAPRMCVRSALLFNDGK